MIEKGIIASVISKPKKIDNVDSQMNIFNEINLNLIFSNDEIGQLLNENAFSNSQMEEDKDDEITISESVSVKEKPTNKNKFKGNFDRMSLILKFLQLSIDKLHIHKEKTVAKGLEWVLLEIQDSLIFKSDEKTLKHLEKLKNENQDIQLILNWVEEYSTLNANQNIFNNLKKKDFESNTKITHNPRASRKSGTFLSNDLFNNKTNKNGRNINADLENILNYNSKLNNLSNSNNYLNFSEDIIVTIDETTFDVFQLDKSIGKNNTLSTISYYIFIEMGLYSIINYSNFENFIELIRKGYNRKNPYHTDLHAADVQQTCYLFFRYGGLKDVLRLNDLDCAAFLISAIIHDFKHPGMTNNFLINSKNEIALRYNGKNIKFIFINNLDQSVLENYHVSEAFKIIHGQPDTNIFSELSQEEYKVTRKRIVDCVLATDMTLHNKEYSYIKLKLETFNIVEGKNREKIFENLDSVGIFNTQQEFLNTLIHTADISNPTKPLHIYEKWVSLVMDEFWLQGDKEKEMCLPISFLCDRTTVKVPASQLGFMDGIVFPLVQIVVGLMPGLKFMIENINTNKAHFKKIKEEEDEKYKK